MDLISKRTIRDLLKRYNAKPSKGLGQNFLIDKTALQKIIKTAGLQPEDIVLEVGPGIGTLTQGLAKRAKKVIAVEKDRKMAEILTQNLKDYKNVKVVNDDILKIGNWKLIGNWKSALRGVCFASRGIGNYKVVANLPYYITSPVIREFLEMDNPPKIMVLMVQKEVAQRICAKPPQMNLLAVSVQFYAKPEIISYVSKKSFWPTPKVDSTIIKITPLNSNKIFACAFSHRASSQLAQAFRILFFRIVRAGFSQPRKQLVNNFSKGLALSLPKGLKLNKTEITAWLLKNNIQPTQRAETLTIEDWMKLTESFN